MKKAIHRFLNESPIGSALVIILVLSSLAIFTLETEFTQSKLLIFAGKAIAIVFAIEYFTRVWVANVSGDKNARKKYITSFSGIIDLCAFLPALLLPGAGSSVVLRMLRILRLMQFLKISSVSRGISRIGSALNRCRAELAVSVLISLGLIFIGAVFIYFAEAELQPEAFGSIPRALWWSMATLTTVGYGDVYPISATGKLIASAMAIIGIGAVALPAGIIANAFMTRDH